ncbi:hypothetical protein VP01_3494g1 [Puccinia sorghi]|uniref:Uncharacterized protein n=1 Tax=Puccinia sorghi TaxID=27349 RepID=A0A0L6UWK7_9BASI|nr:hypothetical protein VP01_3494g1 [Puccinia sorghi]
MKAWLNHFWRIVGVTTEDSWEFLHVNCRQLSKFFFAVFSPHLSQNQSPHPHSLSCFLYTKSAIDGGKLKFQRLWLGRKILPIFPKKKIPILYCFILLFLSLFYFPFVQSDKVYSQNEFISLPVHVLLNFWLSKPKSLMGGIKKFQKVTEIIEEDNWIGSRWCGKRGKRSNGIWLRMKLNKNNLDMISVQTRKTRQKRAIITLGKDKLNRKNKYIIDRKGHIRIILFYYNVDHSKKSGKQKIDERGRVEISIGLHHLHNFMNFLRPPIMKCSLMSPVIRCLLIGPGASRDTYKKLFKFSRIQLNSHTDCWQVFMSIEITPKYGYISMNNIGVYYIIKHFKELGGNIQNICVILLLVTLFITSVILFLHQIVLLLVYSKCLFLATHNSTSISFILFKLFLGCSIKSITEKNRFLVYNVLLLTHTGAEFNSHSTHFEIMDFWYIVILFDIHRKIIIFKNFFNSVLFHKLHEKVQEFITWNVQFLGIQCASKPVKTTLKYSLHSPNGN